MLLTHKIRNKKSKSNEFDLMLLGFAVPTLHIAIKKLYSPVLSVRLFVYVRKPKLLFILHINLTETIYRNELMISH